MSNSLVLVRTIQAAVSIPVQVLALTETQLQLEALRVKDLLTQTEDAGGASSVPASLVRDLEIRYRLCRGELDNRKASRAKQRMYRLAA